MVTAVRSHPFLSFISKQIWGKNAQNKGDLGKLKTIFKLKTILGKLKKD